MKGTIKEINGIDMASDRYTGSTLARNENIVTQPLKDGDTPKMYPEVKASNV